MQQNENLKLFIIKVLTIFIAAYVFFILVIFAINANLKTGSDFWGKVEEQIYKIADDPDLPEEKRQKIIAALKKISQKYQPYINALTDQKQQ